MMDFRNFCRATWLLLIACACKINSQAQDTIRKNPKAWWNESYPSSAAANPKSKLLSRIHVSGNHLVNAKGDTLLFRGLSIADPDKLVSQGHWDKGFFEKIKELGCMLVRIPVHPVAWRGRGPLEYLQLLDQAADWCTDLGMYVIIDWHSIGNLKMELFQDPMYNTSQKESFEFWRMIAKHFAGYNTVAFYELFNEPTTFRGQLGNMSWSEWKKLNEDIILLIRSYDFDKIPLVAGMDWAYDLTPIREEPISADGIAYVSHPYPWKRQEPWPPKWEEDFGFAAAKYPIIATEIGFGLRKGDTIGPNHYAYQIIHYLESRRISWVAWVYDPEWGPPMLKSWNNFDLTQSGEFFKKAMLAKGIIQY
jgi:aryl-phospho-beta-D-glucosidase BglC (GH1 family)